MTVLVKIAGVSCDICGACDDVLPGGGIPEGWYLLHGLDDFLGVHACSIECKKIHDEAEAIERIGRN